MDQRQLLLDKKENRKEKQEAEQVIISEIENREKVLKELKDDDRKYTIKIEEENRVRIEREEIVKNLAIEIKEEADNLIKNKKKS